MHALMGYYMIISLFYLIDLVIICNKTIFYVSCHVKQFM